MGTANHTAQPRTAQSRQLQNILAISLLISTFCLAQGEVQSISSKLDITGLQWTAPNFQTPTKRSLLDTYFDVDHKARPLAYVSTCEQSHLRYIQQSLYKHLGYGLSSEPAKADLVLRVFPYPCRKYHGEIEYWNTRFHYAYPQWFKNVEEAKSPLRNTPGVNLKQLMSTRKNPAVILPPREEGHKMLRSLHSKLQLCENAQEIAVKFASWATLQSDKKLAVSSRTMVVGRGWTAPPCVSLPAQLELGEAATQDADLIAEWPLWAHKTEGSYLGAGVLSISPLKRIIADYKNKKTFYRPAAMVRPGQDKNTKLERSFASAYMKRPFLYKDASQGVLNHVKTDFRTWALIAGTFPPRVYICKQGLFRSADPSASWDTSANDQQLMDSFVQNKERHVTNAVQTKRYLVTSLNGAFDAFANTGPLLPQYAEAMERDGIDSNQTLHDARMASTYVYVNQFNKADCVVQKQLCNRHFVTGFADIGLSDTGEVYIFEMAMHTIYKNRPGDTYGKDTYIGGNLMHAVWSTRAIAGAPHIGGGKLFKECEQALTSKAKLLASTWSSSWLQTAPSPLQASNPTYGETRSDILATMCAEKILAANLEVDDMISGGTTSPGGEKQKPLWQRDLFLASLLRDDHKEMLQAFEDLLGDFTRAHPLYVEIGGKSFT